MRVSLVFGDEAVVFFSGDGRWPEKKVLKLWHILFVPGHIVGPVRACITGE